jgi:hypothetical protein
VTTVPSHRPESPEPELEPRVPWWGKPSCRLPILLAILAGTAVYGLPRLGGSAASSMRTTCDTRVESQPHNARADQVFVVQDAFMRGTWGRTDPCDGTWYQPDHAPPDGGRWIPNGTALKIDCARTAAPYSVRFTNGARQTWSTWLHTQNGFWIPSILGTALPRNSFAGLPAC